MKNQVEYPQKYRCHNLKSQWLSNRLATTEETIISKLEDKPEEIIQYAILGNKKTESTEERINDIQDRLRRAKNLNVSPKKIEERKWDRSNI